MSTSVPKSRRIRAATRAACRPDTQYAQYRTATLAMGHLLCRPGAAARLPDNHAAAVRQAATTPDMTMGIQNKYRELRTVTATKQAAKLHAVARMEARFTSGRPPSCHARTAAKR